MIAVEGDLFYREVLEESPDVVPGGEPSGEDVEGGEIFVGLEDVGEGSVWVRAVMDDQFVRIEQLDLFIWGELYGERVVYDLLDLYFFLGLFGLPAARSASLLPQFTDRFGLIAIDHLNLLDGLIPNLITIPLNLPRTGLRARILIIPIILILHLTDVLLLQVDKHVGLIERQIDDIDDLVAQLREGGKDLLFDGFRLF